ncbi:MAG: hypothetical protein GY814_06005 [Gammaproteobacteria bacterium]|nr:hypothetical protein [Gammaproteobacteria bacterium]
MTRSMFYLLAVVAAVLALPGVLVAASYGAEFAAEAVRSMPQQKRSLSAQMYVGKEGVRRVEYVAGSKPVVEIIIPVRGITWRLNPGAKTYTEFVKTPTPSPAELQVNPCAGQSNVTCTRLGREKINNRDADKWEIIAAFKNQDVKMLRWVDVNNGFPLIQQMPNGQKAEMRLLGSVKVNGRQVEKWELVSSWGERSASASSFQWYDPVLKLAVREEGAASMVNELRNIQPGPQPEHLFQLPAGYSKIDAPKQGGLRLVPTK